MIKIQSVLIENVRGIKRLLIDLNGNSLIIHGFNATGKSGVIDAIEFGLTGEISRLSGLGTANISVKTHAPHVDFIENPSKAKVTIKVKDKSDNIYTISRSVDSPKKVTITPDNSVGKNILSFLKEHPEFALSRKEILKFITAEPSKRAKEVQIILKMEAVEKLRASFQSIFNQKNSSLNQKKEEVSVSRTRFLTHLNITELKEEIVLNVINQKRKLLNLKEILKIEAATNFSEEIVSSGDSDKKVFSKKESIKTITHLLEMINEPSPPIVTKLKEMKAGLEKIVEYPEIVYDISKQQLYEDGLKHVVDDECPLCDNEWDIEKLKAHIKNKIEKNKYALNLKNIVINGCKVLKSEWNLLLEQVKEIVKSTVFLKLQNLKDSLETLLAEIEKDIQTLEEPFTQTNKILQFAIFPYFRVDSRIKEIFGNILTVLENVPDLTTEENAKNFLLIANERFQILQEQRKELSKCDKQYLIAKQLLDKYTSISEEKLSLLYQEVEKEFSNFYRKINQDDEANFSASLTPNQGGLNFEVDFYSRGLFPPNALHSEGHQDGMGLCLYFALAKRLLNNNFTFCLLDDVLLSVDINHRREFCRFLKAEFPDTQFIITTHDEVWAKNLNSEGVVKSTKQMLHFRKWSVDTGPLVWDIKEVWDEIDSYLDNSQMADAAHEMRRYLEYILGEISYKLRAKLEARASTSYDLNEVLTAVVSQYKELLKKAKNAANSWNQKDKVQEVDNIDKEFSEAYTKTNAEQWAINPLVHYNAWANLSQNDFKPVKNAFDNLLSLLKCKVCDSWIYASPIKGQIEVVRCDCGQLNLNLKRKS